MGGGINDSPKKLERKRKELELADTIVVPSDFGISTTAYFQKEKSGVYAAYREHQINTICISRKWTPSKEHYIISDIIK